MRFADCEPAPVQPVAAAAPQAAPEQEPPLAEAPAPQVVAVPVPYLLSLDEYFGTLPAWHRPIFDEVRTHLDDHRSLGGIDQQRVLEIACRLGAYVASHYGATPLLPPELTQSLR